MFTYSVPDFWLGHGRCSSLFAVTARLVPDRRLRGRRQHRRPGFAALLDQLHHMFLPALTLTLAYIGEYMIVDALVVDRHAQRGLPAAGARQGAARHRRCAASTPSRTRCCRSSACRRSTSGSCCRARSRSRRSTRGRVSGRRRSRRSAVPTSPMLQGLFLLFSAAMIVANLIVDLTYGYPRPAGGMDDDDRRRRAVDRRRSDRRAATCAPAAPSPQPGPTSGAVCATTGWRCSD